MVILEVENVRFTLRTSARGDIEVENVRFTLRESARCDIGGGKR